MSSSSCHICPASPDDVGYIKGFIRDLAAYQGVTDKLEVSEDLLHKALFCDQPQVHCLIGKVDRQVAGFALYYFNFSTWTGRSGLYLEDLFVQEEYRHYGLGRLLLGKLARIAVDRGCERMEWSVHSGNTPAQRFYHRLGAKPMSEWTLYRLTGAEISGLARDTHQDG